MKDLFSWCVRSFSLACNLDVISFDNDCVILLNIVAMDHQNGLRFIETHMLVKSYMTLPKVVVMPWFPTGGIPP